MTVSNKHERVLYLFTMRFPYGTSEPFLENELPFLAEVFESIVLIPLFKDEGVRELPENVTIRSAVKEPYGSAGPGLLLRYIKAWQIVRNSVVKHAPDRDLYKKQWPMLRSRLRQAIYRAEVIRKDILPSYDPQRAVMYSYWNYDWALALGILRLRDDRIRFVTRMLGFDMFKFRAPDGWPAFREFKLET